MIFAGLRDTHRFTRFTAVPVSINGILTGMSVDMCLRSSLGFHRFLQLTSALNPVKKTEPCMGTGFHCRLGDIYVRVEADDVHRFDKRAAVSQINRFEQFVYSACRREWWQVHLDRKRCRERPYQL